MRKKHPEHVNLERWLVSYADFITLLFAFFVVMYSISQADIEKFRKVAASLKDAFAVKGPGGAIDLGKGGGGDTVNQFESIESRTGRVIDMPAGRTNTAGEPDRELVEMREKLEESMTLELGVTDLSDRVDMTFDSRGLVLKISAKGMFEAGKSEVSLDMRPVLDRIGKVVTESKREVRIEGHTDPSDFQLKGARPNTPARDAAPDATKDWELSTARAAWVANYWIARFELDPKRIDVGGYGSHRPLSDKTDAWSSARNRRVEIVLSRKESGQ